MTVRGEVFGRLGDGRVVERHRLSNETVDLSLITWGAAVQSLLVPDRDGNLADAVLGFDDLESYVAHTEYFGAVVGRFANRIAGGRFEIDGEAFQIEVNDGSNALHGGQVGFDRHLWDAHPLGTDDGGGALRLSRVSAAGEMGFPGSLAVSVTYRLRGLDLEITYEATTDRPTVLNLTNHTYFNLAGAGSRSVETHELTIAAGSYLPVDAGAIPLGPAEPVEGTPMDFRDAKPIGRDLRAGTEQLRLAGGYDHTWILTREIAARVTKAAMVDEASSGRTLEVWTDQPGVQFYSGNFLDGTLSGKGARAYRQSDGFCLETQHFPDSPNQPSYPSTVLRPGDRFTSTTIWRFGTS